MVRTDPHAAPHSPLRRQCAARLPRCCRLHLGKEHQPNSARCVQTRRDDTVLHRACNAPTLRVVGQWVPEYLKRPNHEYPPQSRLSQGSKKDRKKRTEWDFELRDKLDRLANLDCTTCGRIVLETPKMENKYGWKHIDKDLLALIDQAGCANLR